MTETDAGPPGGFPLVDSSYDNAEILRCIETLLSGQLTMGERVRAFETAFCGVVGAKSAVMVNSGSSANLLAVAAAVNPVRAPRLIPGDRVAVPAVCWSTSLWPVLQHGLEPVLVDVDPLTLNISIEQLERAVSEKQVRAVMMVHILGNSTDVAELLSLVDRHELILIEDTCESLGSTYAGRWLGTLGAFGTYSFYFSHHMTTIEGGMVVCKTQEDEDLLRTLRSHGWSRDHSRRTQFEDQFPHIDPRFLFINLGYNLRPMEIQAAFGLEQLTRLDAMNQARRDNVLAMRSAFETHPDWSAQLRFPRATTGLDPCWFGFPFIVESHVTFDPVRFRSELLKAGIDTRPIVSGNMALQPAVEMFNVNLELGPFSGAQEIHERGLFIGAHAKPLHAGRIDDLVGVILESLQG
jgi:CDP-4-dehydro-6-deoxyglucose reductase, E1